MRKVITVMVLTMIIVLTGCSDTVKNEYNITDVEHDKMVNYIAIESITINDEVFTLYEVQDSDGELLETERLSIGQLNELGIDLREAEE